MAELEATEAERQLAAAVERHREVVAAVTVAGLPDRGQHTAVSALARGAQLLAFTLTRAAAAGVPRERLVEIVGGDDAIVDEAIERGPAPSVIERLAPAGVDRRAVAQAAVGFEASARVGAVVQAILADVEDPSWSPTSAELDLLAEDLADVWRQWRQDLGR